MRITFQSRIKAQKRVYQDNHSEGAITRWLKKYVCTHNSVIYFIIPH